MLAKLLPFIKGKIRALSSASKYKIKPGYIHKKEYTYLDKTEGNNEWQQEVYDAAKYRAEKNRYKTIIDFGCGSALKLLQKFPDYDTIGVEVGETVTKLKQKYPDKNWYDVAQLDTEKLSADLVICADVIEHVLDPDDFLKSLNKIDFKYLYISTPDRNILHSPWNYGPPRNPYHIREWSAYEFRKYIEQFFKVELQQITNYQQATQLLICKKK